MGPDGVAPEPLERALAEVALKPADVHLDAQFQASLGGDKFALPVRTFLMSRPLEIPYVLSHTRGGIVKAGTTPHALLEGMLAKVNVRMRRGEGGWPGLTEFEKSIAGAVVPLAEVIRTLDEKMGQPLGDRDLERLQKSARAVPRDVQKAACVVLYASVSAAEWHRLAFERVHDLLTPEFVQDLTAMFCSPGHTPPRSLERVAEQTDFASLYAGAEDLTLGVERALDLLRDRRTTETFAFNEQTPLGRIVLRAGKSGPEGEVPEGESPLLLLDLDGDDVYHTGGAAVGPDRPVSVLIDLGGNDRYEAPETSTGSFGSGVLGYGILVDTGGNDKYQGGGLSQGVGLLGVGMLIDLGNGRDTYDAVATSQGAGAFGVGLLLDEGGGDTFRSFTQSQGFGFTLGCGYLLNLGKGDDSYTLRNDSTGDATTDARPTAGVARFPSAQDPQHNASLGQGCGMGRRGDLSDGHSWAGGFGLLYDAGGNDTYRAEVMAQGCGYWYGVGCLIDDSGDDKYHAFWYGQGAAAHFAVGALLDYAGNDTYVCDAAVAQGAAHDGSVAWLVDAAGNDSYRSPTLSLGAAAVGSIGVFLDVAGDDRYEAASAGTAAANPWHVAGGARTEQWGSYLEDQLNLGLFLDCGGRDTYTGLPGRDNHIWRDPAEYPALGLRSEYGVGVDADNGGFSPVRLHPLTEAAGEK